MKVASGDLVIRGRAVASWKSILLVALHLFVFNGVFVFRFPTMKESIERRMAWERGTFSGNVVDYVRLYFTTIVERNYYEWGTAVLGKQLEEDYPLFDRNREQLETLTTEPPRRRAPYREVFFEYPPVLMAPILAARAPVETFWGFTRSLALVISLAYLACIWVAYRVWQLLPDEKRLPWPGVLFLSLAGVLGLGQLYVTRLDVFPSLVVLLALWMFLRGRWYASAAWVAVGFLTKGYAIVLAPIFALVLARQRRYRELVNAAEIGVGILAVVNLSLGWYAGGAYWESYRYHAARGLQIESIYALIPYLANLVFQTPIRVYDAFNSMNIEMAHGGWLLTATTILPVVGLIGLYVMLWKQWQSGQSGGMAPLQVVRASVLAILMFMLTFKVLSPQFLIWLTPLIYLAGPARPGAFFTTFFAMLLLTQMIWPNFYWLLEGAHPIGVAMLLVRNVGLIVLFAWLLIALWRENRPAAGEPVAAVPTGAC